MEKYKQIVVTGLNNMGNTCYMNTCLQILSHIYELNLLLDSNISLSNSNESIITKEWINLKNVMWSGDGVVNPKRFLHFLQKVAKKMNQSIFMGFDQNDCDEFFMFIIDCFHKSIARSVDVTYEKTDNIVNNSCCEMIKTFYKKEYSEILDIFNGIQVSLIVGKDGKINNSCPEFFSTLNLPVVFENKIINNIYGCLDAYFNMELLNGDNMWFNDETQQKQEVIRCYKLWKYPNILTIVLKRYHNGLRKIQNVIDFPLENLNMGKYSCYNNGEVLYDCFGICNHSGNVMGGHYTCFIRKTNNKWYLFNDNVVSQTEPKHLITNQSYCLFYRKK